MLKNLITAYTLPLFVTLSVCLLSASYLHFCVNKNKRESHQGFTQLLVLEFLILPLLFVLQFVTHDSNVTHNNICEKYSSWAEKRIFMSNQYTGGLMWNARLNLCFSLKERLLIPHRPNAGWPYSQTSYSHYLCPAHVGLITVSLVLYVALITSSNCHCCQLGGAR